MAKEKRVLMWVFKPDKLKTTQEMREWFVSCYPRFLEMGSVEFKCWWCDQERQEWGAFDAFKSEKAMKEYVTSDVWQKIVPEKYGCKPTWTMVEVGLILSKKIITAKENSWISD